MGNSNATHFRYKLNDNWKKSESVSLERVNLYTDRWTNSDREYESLKNYIRTKTNPNGCVDYEEYVPSNPSVTKSSKELYERVPSKYTRDEIGSMSRPELVEVLEAYGVDCVRKKADWLREKIITSQQEHLEDITQPVSSASEDLVEKDSTNEE